MLDDYELAAWVMVVIIIALILAFIGACVLFTFLTMFLLADFGVTLKPAIWLTIVVALMLLAVNGK